MADPHLVLTEQAFAELLLDIVANDTVYETRYRLVYTAVAMALGLGYDAGVRLDPDNPDWPVAYVELPQGQCSWHMPMHRREWDGHDQATKFRRIAAYAESVHLP